MALLLVIDNYDSFTYNLVQMFIHPELSKYNIQVKVVKNDHIKIKEIEKINPDYILISPGPKDPDHSGISIDLIKTFSEYIPILGVCLGMQCINQAFGGDTVRAPIPVHGKTSQIYHDNKNLFKGIKSPFYAARYHSLMIKPPYDNDFIINAQTKDGVIMGISHLKLPLAGVQFHPESFLTEHGYMLIKNFLNLER